MEDYKQYLNNNADEEERRDAAQVMEGLAEIRLRTKVAEVAKQRAALYRRLLWKGILISVVALAFIAGAASLFLGEKEKNDGSIRENAPTQPSAPTDQQVDPSKQIANPKTPEPIAQIQPSERIGNPRYPAPEVTSIRGNESPDKQQKNLLDQVWYTDYPLKGLSVGNTYIIADEYLKKRDFTAAYLELSRLESQFAQNDTLLYLQGYCLIEMGEGNEALDRLNRLQGRNTTWEPQLQWYRGLAMLLMDDRTKALSLFQKMAAQPKHPYRLQAEKTVKLLD